MSHHTELSSGHSVQPGDEGASSNSFGSLAPPLREGTEGSLLQLTCLILRRRRLIAAFSVGLALLVVAVTLLLPKKYTTEVSFTPVAMDLPSGALASLAGQFGVNIGSDPSTTPDFYASLIQTPDIQRALVETEYHFLDGSDTVQGTFVDLYRIDEGDRGKTLDEALQTLNKKVLTIGYDRQTSIVTVDVRTKWRGLSYQMAARLLALINDFNLNSRQSQASQQRRFLGQRVDTARSELREAENRLQDFLLRNRSYQGDPQLVFEHDRLQREMNLRQDVYATLTQSLEQAKVEAVRNTPSISIVEHASPALRFDRRHTAPKMIAGFAAGMLLATLWVLFEELLTTGKTAKPSDFETLERLWRETIQDFRAMLFLGRHPRGR